MIRDLFILAILSGYCILTSGQSEISMLASSDILQADLYNPARFHQEGWHLGLPAFLYSIYHTGPGYRDLIERREGLPILKVSALRSGLKDHNVLVSDFRFQSFKVKYGRSKWSLGVDHEIIFHNAIHYPDELVLLYLDGNQRYIGETIQIAPVGQTYSFNSYALSLSYKLPRLTVGARPRILFGNHLANTPRASALLTTSDDVYQVTLNTDYQLDNVGLISFDDANFLNYQIESFNHWRLFSGNVGFAIDFGVDFRVSDQLRAGLSLVDLGSIKWKEGSRSYISNQTVEYQGNDVVDIFNIQKIGIEGALDSLAEIFDVQESTESITWRLPAQWLVLINYSISPKLELAAISHYRHDQEGSLTVALQAITPVLKSFRLGTTVSNRYDQFNLGFIGLFEGQKWIAYLATDQILAGINPLVSNHFNVRAGINLHFAGTGSFD
jgi:hypothetical protein